MRCYSPVWGASQSQVSRTHITSLFLMNERRIREAVVRRETALWLELRRKAAAGQSSMGTHLGTPLLLKAIPASF